MISSNASIPKGTTSHRFALLLPAALVVSLGLVTSKLVAQPDSFSGPGGPRGSANSFALNEVSASYSFSSKGDIERNGKLGSAEVSHYEFETSFSLPSPETWRFGAALSWKRDELKLTGVVPLSDELEEIGINFTATKDLSGEIGPGWSAIAMLNPSFASDSGKLSGDSFSLMGIAIISKEVSQTLSWSVGVMGRTRGDMTVLPLVGLRWNFATDWDLEIGFPNTGVSYKFNDALTLNLGARFHGGTYYIEKGPVGSLGNTYLDYQEIRFGLGAEYEINRNFSIVVDGGMTAERSFDYYDRDVKLDGKSVGYGSFSLKYKF